MDGGPVLSVGADVDVQLYVSAGVVHARWFELVKSFSRVAVLALSSLTHTGRVEGKDTRERGKGEKRTMRHDVFEAYVEGGVRVRGEYGTLFAYYIFGFAVLVADVIHDLHSVHTRC